MNKVLTILEVSQKQAYIFSSNSLKDNIRRSGEIAGVTSAAYMQETLGDSIEIDRHIVYAGGGHVVLEFDSKEQSVQVVRCVTGKVLRDLPDLELFAASVSYNEKLTPAKNINALITALEKKKSFRLSSFHHGSFGIEEVNRTTGKPVPADDTSVSFSGNWEEEEEDGFLLTTEFEKLGGSSGDKSFIAVVHVDGNAMGKRVAELSGKFDVGQWDAYRMEMKRFSESVDRDFKTAYMEMRHEVAMAVRKAAADKSGPLAALSLDTKGGIPYLPLRRIITEGDDICFVTDGRIGVECAVLFLKKLAGRRNAADGKPYAACAGIAMVHAKYPFYRAYELAEELCSNAKRFGASLGAVLCGHENGANTGAEISSVDWHVEYGEIRGSHEELRSQYISRDGIHLELRPYIVKAPQAIRKLEPVRDYRHFRRLMRTISAGSDSYAAGRLKELRGVLKQGTVETDHYLRFHKIRDLARDAYQDVFVDVDYAGTKIGSGKGLERKLVEKTADGKLRSLLFDAIELMDLYLPIDAADQETEVDG